MMKIDKPKNTQPITKLGFVRFGEIFRLPDGDEIYMRGSLSTKSGVSVSGGGIIVVNLEDGNISTMREQKAIVKVLVESKLKGDIE